MPEACAFALFNLGPRCSADAQHAIILVQFINLQHELYRFGCVISNNYKVN